MDRGWSGAAPLRPGLVPPPAEPAVPLLNIANVLTMARIALVPLFVLALFAGGGHDTGWRITAAALFGLAAITDRFDGQLARKYGLVTDFGKLADPIADKALIGSALIGLSVLGDLAWWMTIVICGRELGITLLRLVVVRRGVIPAGRGGKLKTLVQSLAIAVLVLPLSGGFATAGMALMWLALVLTVATGLDYVGQAARVWFAGSPRHRNG
ncbi:CDP-diacylglycerol--glycerol-3-phosphate 3-phosphatidyltransferase [Nocardia cyriacigeorgica]|uniref:CDP-diacylglycerol--glycerol-3-phosphate 3-phosphatidyltransferase n=2 Tax=Nocardia cyriacigeorgica TaxID=135487 RepID=A0A5R8PJA5_9NOCA|nr:CDP-diacylglycerol--glycerol-3-phosphate 3-phosphatidyltransferase [Nocardia cyriacigeorgica]TLG16623.1 CDP-diacylglycerol--glycerol-3-phosphate 3-phosphatidyltransferase [Nocardia cyriacigeorgica]